MVVFMKRSEIFIVFIIGFLSGILLASFCDDGKMILIVCVVVVGFLFLEGSLGASFGSGERFPLKYFFVLFVGILFGGVRFFLSFEIGEGYVSAYSGDVLLKGCIVDEVDIRSDKVKYTIEVFSTGGDFERVRTFGGNEAGEGTEWRPVKGKVLVNADRYPVYEYGDCLLVFGELARPSVIEDFEYDKYLARYGIYSVIYRAEIEKIEDGDCDDDSVGGGNMFFSWIYSLKQDFEMRLGKIFAEPHASFMSGLILGSRKGISEHLMADFNTTGLTHIIAISGYNITLVIVIVGGMFSFLSRRKKVIVSCLFIIVFVILVGAGAAVVRAAIMGIIGLMAVWFGRQYYVQISLFAAAFFMNLFNPKILVYDVGFQLSFLATAGLVFISPYFEKYFKCLPAFFGIRETVIMTLSAQILALPVIILNFGRLSLISPVANIFVLPFIPLAMIFGFFAVLASYFWNFLAEIFGFAGYLILELMILFVKFFASFRFASINISWFSWWMFLVYYYFVLRWVFKSCR